MVYNGVDGERFNPGRRPELGPALRAELGIDRRRAAVRGDRRPASCARASTSCSRCGDARPPPAASLVLVGDDERLPAWRRQAAEPPLAGRVVVTGPRRDVEAVLAAADVLLRAVAPGGVRQRGARGLRGRRAGGDEPPGGRRGAARRAARGRSWSTIPRTSTRSRAAIAAGAGPGPRRARRRRAPAGRGAAVGARISTHRDAARGGGRWRLTRAPVREVRMGGLRAWLGARRRSGHRASRPTAIPIACSRGPTVSIVKLQRKVMVGRVTTAAGSALREALHRPRVAHRPREHRAVPSPARRAFDAARALRRAGLRHARGGGRGRGAPARPAAAELLRHPRGDGRGHGGPLLGQRLAGRTSPPRAGTSRLRSASSSAACTRPASTTTI